MVMSVVQVARVYESHLEIPLHHTQFVDSLPIFNALKSGGLVSIQCATAVKSQLMLECKMTAQPETSPKTAYQHDSNNLASKHTSSPHL